MPNLPSAAITHFTTRRLRIKVPEKRRDAAFFDFVRSRLAAWNSIQRVDTNPLTASILVYFSDTERLLLEAVAKNDFLDIDFDLFAKPAEPVVTRAAIRSFETSDFAQRLVGFLPVRGHVAEPGRQRTGACDKTYSNAVTLLACLALGAAVLLVML
jgi:hypothetical protein